MSRVIFDYSKLKGRIIEKYGTYGNFAIAVNSRPSKVSRVLNNALSLSKEELITWCDKLEINYADSGVFFYCPSISQM